MQKAQIGSLLALLPFMAILAVFLAPMIDHYGLKRSFVQAYSGRLAVTILLLTIPLVISNFGRGAALGLIVIIVSVFGLLTTIAFTAYNPWAQEHIPDDIRGKNSAIKNGLASLFGFIAMLIAGYVLGPDPGLQRFMILIAIGILVAVGGVWGATHIPGGESTRYNTESQASLREMVASIRDVNFVYFLIGLWLVTIATGPQISFVPLFMKEQVGLSSNQVVWLDTGTLMGGLLSSYFWGWLADRYGSKPIMLFSILMLALLPMGWLFMPRHFSSSIYIALAIAMWSGASTTGWVVGYWRLLCVRVVPVVKRTAYMAVYYACIGMAGGLGQLFGGYLVDLSEKVSGHWWILALDQYTVLFLIGVILPLIAFLVFRWVKTDSTISMGQFAGMFLRGNPFLALEGLYRYYRARDERTTVAVTERLGSTKSPLAVEELLQALQDPRFFVRFEAVMSISRCKPDPVLTDALIETLEGNEPALSTISAWALGKVGDNRALEALRNGLNSPYRSVQVYCIRSLGSMGDRSVAAVLMERFTREKDKGLLMALATALGQLGVRAAAGPMLHLMRTADQDYDRIELAVALARLVGNEHRFVQLQRQVENESKAGLSKTLTDLKKKMARSELGGENVERALAESAKHFERNDISGGVESLLAALEHVSGKQIAEPCNTIIQECIEKLGKKEEQRQEYLALSLHALENATADYSDFCDQPE